MMLVITAIPGLRRLIGFISANCHDESSRITGLSEGERHSSIKVSGETVIFPPRSTFGSWAFKIWYSADTVVDFPLLPVTAIRGLRLSLKKTDMSVSTCEESCRNLEFLGTAGFL